MAGNSTALRTRVARALLAAGVVVMVVGLMGAQSAAAPGGGSGGTIKIDGPGESTGNAPKLGACEFRIVYENFSGPYPVATTIRLYVGPGWTTTLMTVADTIDGDPDSRAINLAGVLLSPQNVKVEVTIPSQPGNAKSKVFSGVDCNAGTTTSSSTSSSTTSSSTTSSSTTSSTTSSSTTSSTTSSSTTSSSTTSSSTTSSTTSSSSTSSSSTSSSTAPATTTTTDVAVSPVVLPTTTSTVATPPAFALPPTSPATPTPVAAPEPGGAVSPSEGDGTTEAVLGVIVAPDPPAAVDGERARADAPSELAFTGPASALPAALLGGGFMLSGGALLLGGRRRTVPDVVARRALAPARVAWALAFFLTLAAVEARWRRPGRGRR